MRALGTRWVRVRWRTGQARRKLRLRTRGTSAKKFNVGFLQDGIANKGLVLKMLDLFEKREFNVALSLYMDLMGHHPSLLKQGMMILLNEILVHLRKNNSYLF